MTTPTLYSSIYDIFLSQIYDPVFTNLVDSTQDEFMHRYLLNSIPKFRRCLQDLTNRDDVNMTFNIALTDEEQLILGTQMVVEYLNPWINSTEKMQQSVSNKDFTISSPASLLKELTDLRNDKRAEVQKLIVDYTYNNTDLTELG